MATVKHQRFRQAESALWQKISKIVMVILNGRTYQQFEDLTGPLKRLFSQKHALSTVLLLAWFLTLSLEIFEAGADRTHPSSPDLQGSSPLAG